MINADFHFLGNPLSTQDAMNFCNSNSMSLYQFSDADSFNEYKKFVNNVVLGNYPSFIANGIESNGNWVLYTNQSVSLYDGLVWTTAEATTSPSCLGVIRGSNSILYAYAIDCIKAKYFMCEFY
jgi:hypothetical protein